MEGELWRILYRWIVQEANQRPRTPHVQYADGWILAVFFWAVLNDRPVRWACQERNWPPALRCERDLPVDATMSVRLRTLPLLQLLASLLDRLVERSGRVELVQVVDAIPLAVGGCSKDRDARWGRAADHKARGYKLFDLWGISGLAPTAWTLGPMNLPEPLVAREKLLGELCRRRNGLGGYLLGDALYDSNPLHQACAAQSWQLIAPRKKPDGGLGHREHEPSRLRSIQLTETAAPGDLPASGPAPFGRDLYRLRGTIERRQGNLRSFGGGLAPLPAWVRRPRRVARWVAAKLIINGLRQCRLEGFTT